MAEPNALLRELEEGLRERARFELALQNIANGRWNAGRKPEDNITAMEYAQQALDAGQFRP